MELKTAAVVAKPAGTMKLPVLVFGIVEIRRLKRELEALEEYIAQTSLREPGKQAALPRVSRLLDALATENHLNLLQPADRQQLDAFLRHVEQVSPTIHMSFATDPSSAFTAKVVSWLRANIAADALLDVGLQPNIAAGCIARTNNKIFDMSLRERFSDSNSLLMEALEKVTVPTPVAPAPPQAEAAVTAVPASAPAPAAVPQAPVAAQAPATSAVPQASPAQTVQPQPTGAAA